MYWLPFTLLVASCRCGEGAVSEWFVKVADIMFFENIVLCK